MNWAWRRGLLMFVFEISISWEGKKLRSISSTFSHTSNFFHEKILNKLGQSGSEFHPTTKIKICALKKSCFNWLPVWKFKKKVLKNFGDNFHQGVSGRDPWLGKVLAPNSTCWQLELSQIGCRSSSTTCFSFRFFPASSSKIAVFVDSNQTKPQASREGLGESPIRQV